MNNNVDEAYLSSYVEELLRFLIPWQWLWNAHLVDLFTERTWEHLPASWLASLASCHTRDLLLVPSGCFLDTWPSDLKAFVHSAHRLSLHSRFPFSNHSSPQGSPSQRPERVRKCEAVLAPSPCFSPISLTSLPPLLLTGMGAKKKHEVSRLASLVSGLAGSLGICHVLDLGAGQGYLSQLLAFHLCLDVAAVDLSEHHAAVVAGRAARIRKHLRKKEQRGRRTCAPWRECARCR